MTVNAGKEHSIGLLTLASRGLLAAMVCVFVGTSWTEAIADADGEGDILVVRLVHPDQQSVAILKLFEGARMKHPAAALASWKAAARPPRDLGKPLEALIAFFNPEMAGEWRVMHGAKLAVNWDAAHYRPAWYVLVPRDDGTIAAAVTAARLSDGGSEASLDFAGTQIAVERLGRPGASLAAHVGDTLVFGSSRGELLRAARCLSPDDRGRPAEAVLTGAGLPLESGASFVLDPTRLRSEVSMPLPARVAGELLLGLSCRRVEGSLALKGDSLGLEVSSLLQIKDRAGSALWDGMAPIDPAWLDSVPASGAMAVVTLAFRPTREFWDAAFALAERVDKTDTARAGLAPLRTRLNLLAKTTGVRLEADLWPRLRGLTAAVLGEPSRPGHPTGALLVLHLDSEAAAVQLVSQSSRALAKLIGRDVSTWHAGNDVLVAWGNGVATAARDAAARHALSVAPLCTDWLKTGKPAPHRLVVFWPARCWPLEKNPFAKSPAWSVLADDPPAVWLGWNQKSKAYDAIRWQGLERRLHRFLEQVPIEQASAR